MPRVKISLPEKPAVFSCEIQLRVTDMNYGNHMGNEVVLALAHEARVKWLNALGYSEMDIEGKSIIQADAAVVYHSEGKTADAIQVSIYVDGISRSGFELVYQMHNLTADQSLAIVKTGMVFFNYQQSKVESCPEAFVKQFA